MVLVERLRFRFSKERRDKGKEKVPMRFVVALIAVLALVSVANADQYVWFTAVGQNPNSTVTTDGTQGNALSLKSASNASAASWLVTVHLSANVDPVIDMDGNPANQGIITGDIGLKTSAAGFTGAASSLIAGAGWSFDSGYPKYNDGGTLLKWTASGSEINPGETRNLGAFFLNLAAGTAGNYGIIAGDAIGAGTP
jgi:hypothetical protein